MKKIRNLLLLCAFIQGGYAEDPKKIPDPPTPDAAPEALHAYAMMILEDQANQWATISENTGKKEEKDLYLQVVENYRLLKMYREEKFLAEQQNLPVHYEKLIRLENHHKAALEQALLLLGEKNAPQPPPEVLPEPKPEPDPTPVPPPKTSYTTESGFEVKLKLED